MKSVKYILLFVVIKIFLFVSCNANLTKKNTSKIFTDEQIPTVVEGKELSDFKTNFGKAVFMTVNAAKDVYQVLNENGLIENSCGTVCTKGGINKQLVSFDELGRKFSHKLIDTESKFCNTKDANVVKGADEEIAVEDELNKISNDYRRGIYKLVPKYEDGSITDFLTIEDGKIYIGGDVVCNVGSVESIALIETYNRVKNGEDLYKVVEDIQNDVNQLLMDYNNVSTKAVFVNPQLGSGVALSFSGCFATYEPWTDGNVFYQWDGMSDGQKEVVKQGMKIWQDGTNNKIKFIQIEPNAWDWTCYALGQKNWVQMKSDDNVWGEAVIGAGWGSYLKLNPMVRNVWDDENIGTACHELGHVLGLAHEFQRPDRDDYCIVDCHGASGVSKTANFDKMPSKAVVAGFKKVKVLFATLYIPYIWYYDYAKVYSYFDYDSIMQYNGYYIKPKLTNAALKIIKRDKDLSCPRIQVSFSKKNNSNTAYYTQGELLSILVSLENIDKISSNPVLKNYDINLYLNNSTRPSQDDFGAVKILN